MKESIGATWIFAICLTFIVLFTGYIAISVNYSKAFRIKSNIVSQIEERNGYDGDLAQEVQTYLTSLGYSAYGKCDQTITVNSPDGSQIPTDWNLKDCIVNNAPDGQCNACIYSINIETGNDDICAPREYYKVVTFFKFDLPVVNVLLKFPISGDTGYIMAENECV